ncbi:MAG: GAF domain-containing protein [Pseudomonadota bacterium]
MAEQLKVLLAGRDTKALLALSRIIRQHGGDVTTAGDAVHALALAQRLDPQVVVLDTRLAADGSLAVLQGLRASLHSATRPVLLVGSCTDARLQSLLTAGAQDHLEDLFDDEAVFAALQKVAATPVLPPTAPMALLGQPRRLAALAATGLLDSPPEEAFERVTRLVAHLLSTPTALLSLVDEERQFFKSQVGLADPWARKRQTPLTHSFCQWVVAGDSPVAVDDAREHHLLRHNLAIRDLGVIAYAGVPVHSPQGEALGSLCAIDSRPRAWNAQDQATLLDLARLADCAVARAALAREAPAAIASLERYAEAAGAAIRGAMGILRRQGGALQQAERDLLCNLVEECGNHLVQLGRIALAQATVG